MVFINSTLLVQALNFMIAYIILKHILYKPVVAIILAQDAEKNETNARITEHTAQITHALEAQQHELITCQQYALKHKPYITDQERQMPHAPEITGLDYLPEKSLKNIEREITEYLVSKADHAS